MDTIGCANEINALDSEIKTLNASLKEKRIRLLELQECLNTWLERTGETAIKSNGKVIYKITQPKSSRLSKKEKDENALGFLQSIGVSDAKYVLEKLKDVQRGDVEEISKICIDDQKTYEKKMQKKKKQSCK